MGAKIALAQLFSFIFSKMNEAGFSNYSADLLEFYFGSHSGVDLLKVVSG
jgi:hypothetical protein